MKGGSFEMKASSRLMNKKEFKNKAERSEPVPEGDVPACRTYRL